MFNSVWAKKVVNQFQNHGFEWQVEILYFALIDKLNFTTAPAKVLHKRDIKDSSVHPVGTSLKMLLACIKYGFKFRFRFFFSN